MLDDARENVLAFLPFSKAHRKQLASTNPLVRINAEIKRRKDVGRIIVLELAPRTAWTRERMFAILRGAPRPLAPMAPRRAAMKQKIEKWQRDAVRIRGAVVKLADYRRWNHVYEEIISANPRLRAGLPVLDYFRNIYADYAIMAVRRQSKPHRDAVSLSDLLKDIEQHHTFISLSWTRELYRQPHASGFAYDEEMAHRLADSTFKNFADASGQHLSKVVVAKDRADLATATDAIVHHSDKHVAHDQRSHPPASATFDDLDRAINTLEELTRRYVLILTGESLLSIVPYDTTNSISLFRFPWIDPEHPPAFGETV